MAEPNEPIEHELIRNGTLFDDLEILETKVTPTTDNEDLHVVVRIGLDEELTETCGLGVMYTLAMLSFHDARPRGVSGEWFEDDDALRADDFIRELRFRRGQLEAYFDYVRGRCVKTRIELSSDGTLVLDTVNRGEAATRWVDRLRGKKVLRVVGEGGS